MMGFGMSMDMELSQRLELRQELCLTLRQAIIKPAAVCPKCKHQLNEDEVRAGWRAGAPLDFTTECPKCHTRFEARLIVDSPVRSFNGVFTYLCPEQLFYGLRQAKRGRSRLGMLYLSKKHPRLLWNMVRHFGTYERGLKEFQRY